MVKVKLTAPSSRLHLLGRGWKHSYPQGISGAGPKGWCSFRKAAKFQLQCFTHIGYLRCVG